MFPSLHPQQLNSCNIYLTNQHSAIHLFIGAVLHKNEDISTQSYYPTGKLPTEEEKKNTQKTRKVKDFWFEKETLL